MSRKNNKSAWSAIACALLVLGLGLIAFATVGGARNETPTARSIKPRTVPANHLVISRCDAVMLANGPAYGTTAREWRWDARETPWRP